MRPGEAPISRCRSGGFTLVWVLVALALFSLALSVVGPMWAEQARRDREQDLLRIGNLYARAIAGYYASSPGALKQFPPTLNALLEDRRYVGMKRHLRRLYADPLDPSQAWGLVRAPDGGIRGVYSLSIQAPLRQEALALDLLVLPKAATYAEWKFVPKV
jgi:type II secretory pathway pseudopilin PulG